ncbi:hypothetical protein [Microvirga antarctica]|uniref:hypothetical protein n=1 Tax=Microvirga antarctica TaxID=2819233 RepID=UPI001B300367|nr:hypothetical protein [Microvirga antarctica]
MATIIPFPHVPPRPVRTERVTNDQVLIDEAQRILSYLRFEIDHARMALQAYDDRVRQLTDVAPNQTADA